MRWVVDGVDNERRREGREMRVAQEHREEVYGEDERVMGGVRMDPREEGGKEREGKGG